MSAPSNLVLSNQIIREGEGTIERQRELIAPMRADGQLIIDAEAALLLMEEALAAMRLQHEVAVAALRPIVPRNQH